PGEITQQPVELGPVGRVPACLGPGPLELRERGHQRLGDELPAVGAEAVLEARLGGAHRCPAMGYAGCPIGAAWSLAGAAVARTAANSAAIRSWSLCPGEASVPLALSIAQGPVAAIAAATFPASSPPLRISGTF